MCLFMRNIISVNKLEKNNWAVYVTPMGEIRNAYNISYQGT
jgi:hypothetical protein